MMQKLLFTNHGLLLVYPVEKGVQRLLNGKVVVNFVSLETWRQYIRYAQVTL